MTTVRHRPLADRLATALQPCGDVEQIAQLIFGLVATEVPFDFACVATTDPATGLITGACKSRPLPVGDEEFAASEWGGPDINQFADLAARAVPLGLLSLDTDGEPDRCRRFRDFMAPRFGFTDELRLVCRAQHVSWAALALYRGPAEPAFTASDGRVVLSVGEIIADAFRRALFTDQPTADKPVQGRAGTDSPAGPAVLIVDSSGRVSDRSAAAEGLIAELGGWYNGDSLPAALSVVAASARTRQGASSSLIRGGSGRWWNAQAMPLAGPDSSVVLSIGTAPPAAVGELALTARGLTIREQDVVGLVLQGASTKDIAARLHLSPHTVQDHLKSIFEKLAVSSRRELVAQFVR